MKKRLFLTLASAGCLLQAPACINLDEGALLDLGSSLACELLTSGLPLSGHFDYCSVINLDLTPGN